MRSWATPSPTGFDCAPRRRGNRRQFRSSRFCRIRFNRAIRSACHLRHLALRRCASLCNISASAQADPAYAERNAPSLASAALPPRSTQATAPHARSLPYSTCRRIALPYSIGCCSEMWALPPQPYSIQNRRPRGFCALPARASSGVSYGVSVTAYAYIVSNVCHSVSCCAGLPSCAGGESLTPTPAQHLPLRLLLLSAVQQ